MYRIGNGYDVHQLGEGRKLTLCGIHVPWEKGEIAHSDGDVAIHAIVDALLGALALGDIGAHFPDTDAAWAGIDSRILLKKTMDLVAGKGYGLVNLDCTIVLQRPKIRPHIDAMREALAACLNIPVERVSVKATTEEKMGFTGDGSGVKAYAVVLLQKKA